MQLLLMKFRGIERAIISTPLRAANGGIKTPRQFWRSRQLGPRCCNYYCMYIGNGNAIQHKESPLPAKIVVTPYRGGSRVSLIGVSGRELLTSKVFHEPRAKGATVRSLRGLLGDNVEVDDRTVTPRTQAAKSTAAATRTPRKPEAGDARSTRPRAAAKR